MRARYFRFTTVAVAIAAAAACASSEDEVTPPPGPDGGQTPLGDGGDSTTDASADCAALPDVTAPESGSLQTCSAAGWCLTELPDPELTIRDIWPFEKKAFASVWSTTRGNRVIEWNEDIAPGTGWKYIDDGTQRGIPGNPNRIWAPNEDEVYYSIDLTSTTFTGTWGGFLFHGKRPIPPATAWTWTSTRFDCDTQRDLRVWGIGGDVYALSCGRIYRMTGDLDADGGVVGDAGTPSWTVEYTDDDPTTLWLQGGVGVPDDIWFVAARGSNLRCTTIVRKTAAGYQRIVDGVQNGPLSCVEKPGYPMVPALTDFISITPGEIVGVSYRPQGAVLVKIAVDGQGEVSVTEVKPGLGQQFGSLWSGSLDEAWLVADTYRIVHGSAIWSDAASFQYSTIALNGLPNESSLLKIRGTSTSNLWAVGTDRAFHKTTP